MFTAAYGDEDGGDGGGVAGGKGRRNPCGASRWHKMGVVGPSRLSLTLLPLKSLVAVAAFVVDVLFIFP